MSIVVDVIAGAALAGSVAALVLSLRRSVPGDRAFRCCVWAGLSTSGLILFVSTFARVDIAALGGSGVGVVVSMQALVVRRAFAERTLTDYAAMVACEEDRDEPPWWPEFEARFAEVCREGHVKHRGDA
jgi:hypothetical protein